MIYTRCRDRPERAGEHRARRALLTRRSTCPRAHRRRADLAMGPPRPRGGARVPDHHAPAWASSSTLPAAAPPPPDVDLSRELGTPVPLVASNTTTSRTGEPRTRAVSARGAECSGGGLRGGGHGVADQLDRRTIVGGRRVGDPSSRAGDSMRCLSAGSGRVSGGRWLYEPMSLKPITERRLGSAGHVRRARA